MLMKNMFKGSLTVIVSLMLAFSGCSTDETTTPAPPGPPDTGTANFARYVAIGNSLTAGYQSAALSQRDQIYSYPNQIAKLIQQPIEQPLIIDPGIGGRYRLISLSPSPALIQEPSVPPVPSSNLNIALSRPYNNLGIPGAILYDMLDTTDASGNFLNKSIARGNPFFALILRSGLLGNSVFQQAKNLQPTFITCWIGNNDVLGYATSGGTRGTNVGLAAPPKTKPTESALFVTWYRQLLDSLHAIPTAPGIVTANIPDVTSIPFFTTLGPQIHAKLPSGVPLRYQRNGNRGPAFDTTSLAGAATDPLITLTGITYAPLLGQPTGKWYIDNGITSLPAGIDTTKPFGVHPQNPWPDALTLDSDEQTVAATSVSEFNAIIDSVASNRGIGVVDVNSLLRKVKAKQIYDPQLGTFSSDFITGGTFSYDGVHPTSRGQSLVANAFIQVINAKFGAHIPAIALTSAPGIPIGKAAPTTSLPEYHGSWSEFLRIMTLGAPAN